MAKDDLEQTVDESRAAVAEVAREALRRSLNGRAAEIPASLIDALASGTGNRDAVLDATRRIFGTETPLELVLFDTDRIAGYVFESSRPPVIAGASQILRNLNEEIAKDNKESVIFSGGGEGMLLVPAGHGKAICKKIEVLYANSTCRALSVTTGFLQVGPHDFVAAGGGEPASGGVCLVSGTQAVLFRLRDQIRRRKDERWPEEESVAGGSDRCVSCRDRKAGEKRIRDFRPDAPVDGPLCDPCACRWKIGKEKIKGISFEDLVEAAGTEREKAAQYIGFLYVDGNAMGALFGHLSNLAEIRFLSQAVREVFEKLLARARDMVRSIVRGKPTDKELPLVSYLGGGDEVIWILRASLAVHVASKLQDWIEAESKSIADLPQLLRRKPTDSGYLTFGAGLVLCGYTYPVRYQYALAKELQKSAKSVTYGSGKPVSAIDFEVLTESSPLSESLDSARALTDSTEDADFRRSCRPYTARDFKTLLDRMHRLQSIGVAKSQLHALQEGSREGRRVFLNFLRYQVARKPAGEKYQKWLQSFDVNPGDPEAVERFFTQDLALAGGAGTWIADGLQLVRFQNWSED